MKYDRVIVAGTFDRLHKGHELLLETAFINTKNELIIGVTDESMNKNKLYSELIQPLTQIIKNVEEYIDSIQKNTSPKINISIIIINDKYSVSIDDENLNAIVLSNETFESANEINKIRIVKGLKPLVIIEIKRTLEISSTILRKQEYLYHI